MFRIQREEAKAVQGALWISGVHYLVMPVSFLGQMVLARILLPDDFGLFAKAMGFMELLFLVSAFDFPTALLTLQRMPQIEDTVITASIGVAGLFIFMGVMLSGALSWFFPVDVVMMFLVLCIIRAMAIIPPVYGAIALRRLEFKAWSIVRAIATILSVISAIIFASLGLKAWSLVGGQAVLLASTWLGYRFVTGWHYQPKIPRQTFQIVVHFSGQMFIARTLENLFHRADRIILAFLVATKSLGYYDRAQYLFMIILGMITEVMLNVGLPLYTSLQADTLRLRRSFELSTFALMSAIFPVGMLFAFMPDVVVRSLLGSNWLPVAPLIRWLALGVLVSPLRENAKNVLVSAGMVKCIIRVRAMQLPVYLAILVGSVIRWGVVGAAFAFSFALVIETIGFVWYARPLVSLQYIRLVILPLLAALAAGGTGLIIKISGFGSTIAIITALSLYIGLVFLLERRRLLRAVQLLARESFGHL